MKLTHEFYRLPLRFDVARMQQEISQFAEQQWLPHHEGFKGNLAIPLISVNGQINNDFKGPMQTTEALEKCQYLQQVIASFGEVFGRSRLMALEPGCEVPLHSDINYHWYKRVRIHIPIITTDDVIFHCGDKQVNMQQGECWIFDSWKNHKVVNHSNKRRVHLVIDTTGSSKFWRTVANSFIPGVQEQQVADSLLEFQPEQRPQILTEKFNAPLVMSPGEVDWLVAELFSELDSNQQNDEGIKQEFKQKVKAFADDWRQAFSQFATQESGWAVYHKLRDTLYQQTRAYSNNLHLANNGGATQMLIHCLIDPCFNPEIAKFNVAVNRVPATAEPSKVAGNQQQPVSKAQPLPANSSGAPSATPISRNAPCSCGSGKKFKQCCGRLG